MKITIEKEADDEQCTTVVLTGVYQLAITARTTGGLNNNFRSAIIADKNELLGQLETLRLDILNHASTSK